MCQILVYATIKVYFTCSSVIKAMESIYKIASEGDGQSQLDCFGQSR